MTLRSTFSLATVLGALVALTGAPAQAALPAPGCGGLAFSDEKGDVFEGAGPTATNLDITDGYFTTDASGNVKATMKVADMSLMPPPPATAVSWYMTWTVKQVVYYVSLETDLTGTETYETGTYGPNAAGTGNSYTPAGEAKGSVTEGPDGGITWDVPKAAKGSVGQVLSAPSGQSFQLVQNGLGGGVLLFGDDTDPEAGKAYEVGKCEGLSGGGTTGGGTTGGGTTGGGTGGGGTGGAPTTAPTPGSPQPAAKLPLTLTSKSVKAKKGRLSIKLKASDAVTQVSVRVRKGKKAYGTGKLASIAKGATGTVKVKAKKAKKGSYLLDVTARLSDGRLASGAFKLRVK
jgi:hypothetical protein